MTFFTRINSWLERRWVAPAYIGWVLLGLALFFFAAATNTLAGWLYVMSGMLLALLIVAAILPPRNLRGIIIRRQPIQPVSAGNLLAVELTLTNTGSRSQGLFQVIDQVPEVLGEPPRQAIGLLPAGKRQFWRYDIPTERRGAYQWQSVDLRSAAPLGLFWCRRSVAVPASVIIYPQILALKRCPMLDSLGQQTGQQWHRDRRVKQATEGITRSLRPYRWGDPTRLIHWRTSARYGELRVRELEKVTTDQEVLIGLDTMAPWQDLAFEQAVVAAASLVAYGVRHGITTVLWLPQTGLLRDYTQALYALAVVQPEATSAMHRHDFPDRALVWLTSNSTAVVNLPASSRQLCWGKTLAPSSPCPTVFISMAVPLQEQLESLMG
jgi:uncharacterized protein (DUF58 family)